VPDVINIPAFAKINWVLRVLGRRSDQYHEIETVLQTISLHDRLSFRKSTDGKITFSCDDPSLPADRSNLVSRAAHALRARCKIDHGAHISLEKRVPVGSGLGGGSSDAAMTLVGLSRLWNLRLSRAEILSTAAELGADVPFFLVGGRALGVGTGTHVTTLPDVPDQYLLILMPKVSVSTKMAYESLNAPALTTVSGDTILSSSRKGSGSDLSYPQELQNDFEVAVLRLHPEIATARQALLSTGARTAMLAGSGASVFGVFENKEAQERAIQAVKMEAGWRLFPCKTVGREDYFEAVGQTFLSGL
jgi:4-diphosphocytidyl-2-C-methyl-D-erythritol kinase